MMTSIRRCARSFPVERSPAKLFDARARLTERRTEALLVYLRSSCFLPASLVRQSRSSVIARLVASAGPTLRKDALELVADAGLLLFAIDDLLDEADLTDAEVSLRVEQYVMTAAGWPCPEVAFDPIALGLAALRDRLGACACDPALVDGWARSFQRMLIAMARERRMSEAWRRRGSLPTLRDYLDAARDSIGLEMVVWVAWIAMRDPSTFAQLPALRAAERHCSTAVRLANDLRSSERERGEGKVNALVIDGEAARPALLAAIDEALAQGRGVLVKEGLQDAETARFLDAFTRGLVELYRTRDFIAAESAPRADVGVRPAVDLGGR